MRKHVLILSASPRIGGNSDILCDQFMLGAQESGHKVEKINLVKQNINHCMGCNACERTHQCIQQDDAAEIIGKMIKADIIVLATPTYFYSMNGRLKALIDRAVVRYMEITNKDFYFIVAAADSNKSAVQPVIEGLRGFLRCLPGSKEKGIIYGLGAWKAGDIRNNTDVMQSTYLAGKNI